MQLNVWSKEDGHHLVVPRILATEPESDLALLDCWIGHSRVQDLGIVTPANRAGAWITGFGDWDYQERVGTIKDRIPARTLNVRIPDMIHLDGRVRFGDSGGALVAQGKLIGVVQGHVTTDESGLAVPIERVRTFLVLKGGWKLALSN